METEYTFPLAEKVKAFLADPSAFAAAAPAAAATTAAPAAAATTAAPAAAAGPAKAEAKEESEESDEDIGFGLFDQSRQSNQVSLLNLRKMEIKAYFS